MDPKATVTCPFVRNLVRRKVRRLIDGGAFRPQDVDDLEQELLMRLLLGLRRVKDLEPGERSTERFASTVVARSAFTLLRRRFADKRRQTAEPLVDDVEDRLASRRRIGGLDDLRLDLAEILASFPPALRERLESLRTTSVSETARSLGIRRTTLVRQLGRVRRRLREFFSP